MNWLVNLPMRRTIVLFDMLFTAGTVGFSLWWFGDVPPGMVTVLCAVNGVVLPAYMGSSSYETVHGRDWRVPSGEVDQMGGASAGGYPADLGGGDVYAQECDAGSPKY